MVRLTLLALLVLGCGSSASPAGDGGDPDLSVSDDGGAPGVDLQGQDLVGVITLAPGDRTLMLTVAGKMRSVLVHSPPSVGTAPLPLMIALHGNGDTAGNFVAANGLAALADQKGFVLAAPQGISQSFMFMGTPLNNISWDAYRSPAQGNIDLPLLDEIRAQLLASGAIAPKKIFVLGYSQGGYLSFHYGMVTAAQLSCAAVIAAANPLPGSQLVPGAARKIPVTLQIGSNDGAVTQARATRDELMNAGFPVSYMEIAGAGHVPFPGMPSVPIDYCRMQTLP